MHTVAQRRPPPPDPRDFRNALGQFGTGVAVITTCDDDGRPYGLTATSFNSVSLDPPLILWSQGRAAPSHPVFLRAGRFVVHVLSAEQSALGHHFARACDDKFRGVDVRLEHGGLPVLAGAAAHFICTTEACVDGGDHCVFIARVVDYTYRHDAQPLFFWRGRMLAPPPHSIA